jgi:ribonuclease D
LLAEKKQLLHSCLPTFSVSSYYGQKKSFVVPAFYVNAYATASQQQKTESPHPGLHKQLRELRNKICEQKNIPIFYVANSATIDEMAAYLPKTLDDLVKISGFGQAKAKQYGHTFLKLINEYCDEHDLTSAIHKKRTKRQRSEKAATAQKEDTKTTSYNLHKEGYSIADIALKRNLAVSTIEQHLAYFIRRGLISVHELVKTEKLVLIEPLLENFEGNSLVPIKEKLGDAVTFGDIRMVLAAKELERIKPGDE